MAQNSRQLARMAYYLVKTLLWYHNIVVGKRWAEPHVLPASRGRHYLA
jgi:hypothetical protein